jgi:hypothetical protein
VEAGEVFKNAEAAEKELPLPLGETKLKVGDLEPTTVEEDSTEANDTANEDSTCLLLLPFT